LSKRPPQIITKIEKVVERVECIPEDYEEIKLRLLYITTDYENL